MCEGAADLLSGLGHTLCLPEKRPIMRRSAISIRAADSWPDPAKTQQFQWC
jgi:hypothetical protein